MTSDWESSKIGEIVEIKHGFAFKSQYFSDEPTSDILLTPGNFAIGGGFKYDKLKYFNGEAPEEFVLAPGDLLITMTDLSKQSDTLGYPAIVPETQNIRYLHNQRLGLVNIRDDSSLHKRYLYYLLCSKEYRHEIISSATGTTVKHTAPMRIAAFKFLLPPYPEQRAIAHILGSLDDKIELNRQMNQTLEAMARAIFKSWFVDFDPVRAKVEGRDTGLPEEIADLFPDSFEDSEIGEIPKGWQTGPILKIAELISGGTPKTNMPEYWNGVIPWASAKDVSQCGETFLIKTEKAITDLGLNKSSTKIIPSFSSVVVARGATTGRLVMFGSDIAMNQTCYALNSNDFPFYLYCHLRSFIQQLVLSAHGSVFDTITTRTFQTTKTIIPNPAISRKFDEITDPLFKKILCLQNESLQLAALRDTLLPKLISGDLRIPDAEKFVEEAGL